MRKLIDLQKNYEYFYVDQNLEPTNATLYWAGPNVLIRDSSGNVLNAHVLATPGIESIKVPYLPDLEQAIAIANLKNIGLPRITVNSNIYCFSTKEVKAILKQYPDSCDKALYAHVHQAPTDKTYRFSRSDQVEENFRLLIKHEGRLYTHSLTCINHIDKKSH